LHTPHAIKNESGAHTLHDGDVKADVHDLDSQLKKPEIFFSDDARMQSKKKLIMTLIGKF